ncbi:bifunctional adenosylcobinamide kinase/adenosylcobinamide-phosphate guanylyltransferase [Micromonospora sp. NBC_01813]|uniref:bifunctional adenosylcobinamide kinase/adenosylcobinamide-phosphate guanylyltransferase n=1 Tax=Micromonospora sp. NBC_01813 TaxID=2975988 RepID=UPI002DDC8B2B|nr:bifunctional adenosylcobinamide kinase/adenosylcobinamide-phosphate guanylyltransferase [Micromonospora sp. NBC_01813]WSA09541.1 bifunctional adenosylcobinamide kinase/adenosylcobinamide-phosphate guanylyltransferase [Micromonospora sp. NBC_01813]
MSVDGWKSVLVLGGIRSGKSGYAESLVADTPVVRYVATGATDPADAEWLARIEAHRQRRPHGWHTDEVTGHPAKLIEVLSSAQPEETLLVDDLGGWVSALLDPTHQPADDRATIAELAAAVRACPARLVLVSPEAGLALVPTTPVGRAFADALGVTNQAVAEAADLVTLVVAGQPVTIKSDGTVSASAGPAAVADPAATTPAAAAAPVAAAPVAAAPVVAAPVAAVEFDADGDAGQPPAFKPGMTLPMPAEQVRATSVERLATLDQPGSGFGVLERVVGFAAATQDHATPRPWDRVRVVLLHGDHGGGVAAGDSPQESSRRAGQARSGEGPLARLAAAAGADVTVVEAPAAAPIEDGPALTADEVQAALALGWDVAQQAGLAGVQAIVVAACGAGGAGAAAAVLAATTGAEPAAILGRVAAPGKKIDDAAWMLRCAAVRDALHRTRRGTRGALDVLSQYGGGDIAVATGLLLGATANRIPVLLDGPVGVAAALVSRDLAGQARHWCLLPDHGRQPTVRHAADVLGLTPIVDLQLDLGEGTAALAALPLLRCAPTLAGALGEHPTPAGSADPVSTDTGPDRAAEDDADDTDTDEVTLFVEPDDEAQFVEPEPAGPGPASTDTTR